MSWIEEAHAAGMAAADKDAKALQQFLQRYAAENARISAHSAEMYRNFRRTFMPVLTELMGHGYAITINQDQQGITIRGKQDLAVVAWQMVSSMPSPDLAAAYVGDFQITVTDSHVRTGGAEKFAEIITIEGHDASGYQSAVNKIKSILANFIKAEARRNSR